MTESQDTGGAHPILYPSSLAFGLAAILAKRDALAIARHWISMPGLGGYTLRRPAAS